jgi:hypothetical protein
MRLTERSMLNLANDVRAADLLAATHERRRRDGTGHELESRRSSRSEPIGRAG